VLAEHHDLEAEQAFQSVVAVIRANLKDLGFLLANALLDSAKAALARGRFEDASRFAQEALKEDLRKARDPRASADVGEASLLLAKARKALDDAPGAQAAAHQAAVSLAASLGPDHALTRDALALQ
jgi:Arc/MetJ-type ribon-helix-helix transcriptional regulator